jgi:hypothetical protein
MRQVHCKKSGMWGQQPVAAEVDALLRQQVYAYRDADKFEWREVRLESSIIAAPRADWTPALGRLTHVHTTAIAASVTEIAEPNAAM